MLKLGLSSQLAYILKTTKPKYGSYIDTPNNDYYEGLAEMWMEIKDQLEHLCETNVPKFDKKAWNKYIKVL